MNSRLNPFSILIYFLSVMLLPAISGNPYMLILSLLLSVIFILLWCDVKTMLKRLLLFIPFFAIVALINPLIYHDGATILFYLNGKRITLEALLYGINSSIMVSSILNWCISFSKLFSSDKVLYVFGSISSKVATVISLVLRLIPHYRKYIHQYRMQQKLLGLYGSGSLLERIRAEAKLFSGFLAWSLEHSMTTADSMEARGYGKCKRRSYKLYQFRKIDLLFIIVTALLSGLIITAIALGFLKTTFYPQFSIPGGKAFLVLAIYLVNTLTLILYSLYTERH